MAGNAADVGRKATGNDGRPGGRCNMVTRKAAALCALGVFSLCVPALAQDGARDEAVREIPTWESYGATNPEDLEETFFRLAQDFVSTSEIGVRRLGHVPIWPRGELKVWKIRILPYLRQGVEWDTNIYKRNVTELKRPSPDDKEGRQTGWTHTNQAGFLADMLMNGGRTRVSMSADSRWQVRYRQEQPDDWELDSQVGVNHRFNRDVWAAVGYAYERRSDPIEVDFTDRFRRTNNRSFVQVGLDRDIFFGTKADLKVGVNYRDVQPHETGLDDSDRAETEYFARVSYPFWKKTTRIYGQARYRDDNRESDKINDGNVWGFDLGIAGSIPLREGEYRGLRGDVSVGFDHAAYENETFSDDNGVQYYRDENDRNTSLRLQAALQYIMNPRTSIDLRYLRANQFSFRGNYQITDRVDLTLTTNLSRKLVGRFQAFAERSDPSGLTLAKPVDGRPHDTTHHDNVSRGGVGVGFRYPIEDWVDLDVSFDWETRNAEHDNSYSNVRGIMGLTFYFSGLNPPKRVFPQ